mmetsp:Transcript_16548/g.53946  ORF Transcript_16548/g.53946 Transcript_16548/m.53946 type:complete len:206 (+) Transcript_16548:165-782(+)
MLCGRRRRRATAPSTRSRCTRSLARCPRGRSPPTRCGWSRPNASAWPPPAAGWTRRCALCTPTDSTSYAEIAPRGSHTPTPPPSPTPPPPPSPPSLPWAPPLPLPPPPPCRLRVWERMPAPPPRPLPPARPWRLYPLPPSHACLTLTPPPPPPPPTAAPLPSASALPWLAGSSTSSYPCPACLVCPLPQIATSWTRFVTARQPQG